MYIYPFVRSTMDNLSIFVTQGGVIYVHLGDTSTYQIEMYRKFMNFYNPTVPYLFLKHFFIYKNVCCDIGLLCSCFLLWLQKSLPMLYKFLLSAMVLYDVIFYWYRYCSSDLVNLSKLHIVKSRPFFGRLPGFCNPVGSGLKIFSSLALSAL